MKKYILLLLLLTSCINGTSEKVKNDSHVYYRTTYAISRAELSSLKGKTIISAVSSNGNLAVVFSDSSSISLTSNSVIYIQFNK